MKGGISSDPGTEIGVLRNETVTAQSCLSRVSIVQSTAGTNGPEFVLGDGNARLVSCAPDLNSRWTFMGSTSKKDLRTECLNNDEGGELFTVQNDEQELEESPQNCIKVLNNKK